MFYVQYNLDFYKTTMKLTPIFALLTFVYLVGAFNNDRILKTSVSSLIFEKNALTTWRRVAPMNQLICTTGCNLADISKVMCKNIGSDGSDIVWECKTDDLPNNIKFGQIVVSCERYANSQDPYILVGSCGLKYGLEHIKRSTSLQPTSTDSHSYHSYIIISI